MNNKRQPFIIAEMSGNHNQSLERAFQIVDSIAETGVDALKLQTYTADTMTIPSNQTSFVINDKKSLWYGKKLHDLYQEAFTPWEWHKQIFDRCKSKGLICFSTPFDETSVDFLESLNVPMYKIASFENNHLPLIKKVAQTGKPMIISTGMATLSDLEDIVKTARENGCNDLTLLKCTSTYPASPENSNLLTIPHLAQLFDVKVGLSDHTLGIGAAVASVALGAVAIEKHVTLSRAEGGVDAAFSMEPLEMKQLVEDVKAASLALGKVYYGVSSKEEEKSTVFRRSIYAVKNIKKGEAFTSENIRVIRPGFGLAPKYYDHVLNSITRVAISAGTPLKLEMCDL
ncbi:MAG: pseudaminic acid synthase [bacterium]